MLTALYPGVRVGMIYTPHTFGRDLGFKPHVHLCERRDFFGIQGAPPADLALQRPQSALLIDAGPVLTQPLNRAGISTSTVTHAVVNYWVSTPTR